MSRTSIFNLRTTPVTLPPPYGALLGPGKGVIVADDAATALGHLGGSDVIRNVLSVTVAPDGSTVSMLPSDDFADDLLPTATNTFDLGSTALRWKNGWLAGYLVAPSVGPSGTQQHTLPVVASDTVALLVAAQNLSNKTLGTDLAAGGFKVTGLGAPGAAADAATKSYVDTVAAGLAPKGNVRVRSGVDVTIAAPGANVDGVAMIADQVFAAFAQAAPTQKGLYVWKGAAVPAVRANNMALGSGAAGAYFFVEEGTYADRGFLVSNDPGADVVGTNDLALLPFDIGSIVPGAGLTMTGQTLDVGAGSGITVNVNDVALNLAYAPTWTGLHVFAPTAAAGVQTTLTVTPPASTAVPWSSEDTDLYLNASRTITWGVSGGALATNRSVRIVAPTLKGDVGGAHTITDAATVAIENAPTQGSDMILTRAWALWVQAGRAMFAGGMNLGASQTLIVNGNTLVGAVADKLNATQLAIAAQAVGDILVADSTTTFARVADVAVGQVLKSGGVGAAPGYAAIGGTTAGPSAATTVATDTHTHTGGACSGSTGAPSAATTVATDTHTHTGGACSGSTGAPSAATTVATDTHTHAAGAFTGTAPAVAETSTQTGTGFATAGQVVTTTESFTATLNQYAGCWLITASQAPCLVDGHPAVGGPPAPLVLTVYGLAPVTNAETWRILRAPTPAGSVATSGGPSATVAVGADGHTHSGTTINSPTSGGPSATVAVGADGHTHSGTTVSSPTSGGPSATVAVGADGHTHSGTGLT